MGLKFNKLFQGKHLQCYLSGQNQNSVHLPEFGPYFGSRLKNQIVQVVGYLPPLHFKQMCYTHPFYGNKNIWMKTHLYSESHILHAVGFVVLACALRPCVAKPEHKAGSARGGSELLQKKVAVYSSSCSFNMV